MVGVSREEFEEIAEEAFRDLPERFRDAIDNVEIIVEDRPSAEDRDRAEGSGRLLGLYKGIPRTHRGTWYGMFPTLPDRIYLYQKNIESVCRSLADLRRQIAVTLYHELGHYFGMSESEIRQAMDDDGWTPSAPRV